MNCDLAFCGVPSQSCAKYRDHISSISSVLFASPCVVLLSSKKIAAAFLDRGLLIFFCWLSIIACDAIPLGDFPIAITAHTPFSPCYDWQFFDKRATLHTYMHDLLVRRAHAFLGSYSWVVQCCDFLFLLHSSSAEDLLHRQDRGRDKGRKHVQTDPLFSPICKGGKSL